jgi:hypothetical protein
MGQHEQDKNFVRKFAHLQTRRLFPRHYSAANHAKGDSDIF